MAIVHLTSRLRCIVDDLRSARDGLQTPVIARAAGEMVHSAEFQSQALMPRGFTLVQVSNGACAKGQ
jgi:hypothetical protein